MWLFLACGGGSPTKNVDVVHDTATEEEAHFVFNCHIGKIRISQEIFEQSSRLEQAISWINRHKESRQIELGASFGDVGWGTGLSESKQLLDQLDIPYVPIIGDNGVNMEMRKNFTSIYNDQFEWLSENTESWTFSGGCMESRRSTQIPFLPTWPLHTKDFG